MPMHPYSTPTHNKVEMGEAYGAAKDKLVSIEQSINTAIAGLQSASTAPSQADLLAIQYQLQVFGVFMEFASSFEKKLSDMFEGVIRKF